VSQCASLCKVAPRVVTESRMIIFVDDLNNDR